MTPQLCVRVLGTAVSTSFAEGVPDGSSVFVLCPKSLRLQWRSVLAGLGARIESRVETADDVGWDALLRAFPAAPGPWVYVACSARASWSGLSTLIGAPWWEACGTPVVDVRSSTRLGHVRGWERDGDTVVPAWDPSTNAVRPKLLPSAAAVAIAGPALTNVVSSEEDLWELCRDRGIASVVDDGARVVDPSSPLSTFEKRRLPAWWDGTPLERRGAGRVAVAPSVSPWDPLVVSAILLGERGFSENDVSTWRSVFKKDLFVETRDGFTRRDWDDVLRETRSDYVVVVEDPGLLAACSRALVSLRAKRELDAATHRSRMAAVVKPGLVRWAPPPKDGLEAWWTSVSKTASWGAFGDDGTVSRGSSPEKLGLCWSGEAGERRVDDDAARVAVLSMCGVSSFEDRYGLGGEHQVVHWLREEALARSDVALCDQFDQENARTAEQGFYDVVFSNSAWCQPPRTRDGGFSVFWHFNTDSWACQTAECVAAVPYDEVWTNSRKLSPRLSALRPGGVELVDLNASERHHFAPSYDTPKFAGDVCYVGGYQVHYKGKDRIERFVRPGLDVAGDGFSIYGNRKWLSSVQNEALRDDSSFKPEHYDGSWDASYRGVLHPDDFRHVARACKVWLNFNAADQAPLGMINDRPIWALACGAFVITDDAPEQRELFGDAVEYTTGGDDLRGKLERWLSDDGGRAEIAARGPILVKKLGLTTRSTVDRLMRRYREHVRCHSG